MPGGPAEVNLHQEAMDMTGRRILGLVLGAALLLLGGMREAPARPALHVSSAAFREGAAIPRKHTCDGADVSPPLSWSGAPAAARSFALLCDDPDAPGGNWCHWVFYDLPPGTHALPEGVPQGDAAAGGRQGTSDFQKVGYNGPCPPGGTHRYRFHVYALDRVLGIAPRATRAQLLRAMRGHVLADGVLEGRYRR